MSDIVAHGASSLVYVSSEAVPKVEQTQQPQRRSTRVKIDIESKFLFWMLIRFSLLQFLTLGIYRFWATTKLRQYIWSRIAIKDERFEYHGTPFELFKGFLLAIAILGPILAVVQFISFALKSDDSFMGAFFDLAVFLVILFLLPVAYHRSVRYRASRTSWRGLRFHLTGSSLGYAVGATCWNLVTMITFGLLLPRATKEKMKFLMDTMRYGDAKFFIKDETPGLFKGWWKIWLTAFGFLVVLPGIVFSVLAPVGPFLLFVIITLVLPVMWFIASIFIHKRILGELSLGGVTLKSHASAKPVIIGYGFFILTCLAALAVILGVVGGFLAANTGSFGNINDWTTGKVFQDIPISMYFVIIGLGIVANLVIAAAHTILVQTRMLKQMLALSIFVLEGLNNTRVTQSEQMTHGEGLADALDVGSAF